MIEVQFENRYTGQRKMLSEYVYQVLYKKFIRTALLFSAIAAVFLLFSLLQHSYITAAILGVCLWLLLALSVFSPLLAIRQIKKSGEAMHNGKSCETVVRFGDCITLEEGTFSLAIEYDQIIKRYHLKHSYLLMFGKQNAIMISPEHFTVGNFQDFLVFIEGRC